MRTLLGTMFVVMALPMAASGVVLMDQNFDGVTAGTNLEDLGWNATDYTVSSNTIDNGNSASGSGSEAVYELNHTLSNPQNQHYQVDAVVHSTGSAAYFWVQNAAGNNIFFNHAQKWGNAMEFQTQAPPGVTNTQRIGVASADPRIVRLEIFQDDVKFSFDPDDNGNFTGSFSLSENANEQFGFSDIKLLKLQPHGDSSSTFYDSISVQVIPEPSSIVLLVLGSLIMLQRRR